uniref:U-box domain-containing protein 4 n=1 Tax=Anthurium amnicola TaxID=1678845 RepID=A0A1D1Z052_9ARAE
MDAAERSEGAPVCRHHVDWDRLLRLFSDAAAGGGEASQVRSTVELRRLCKRAPEGVLAQTIPVLVDLLGSPSSSVQGAAARSLCCIARRGDGSLCSAVGRSGAIPSLLRLLPLSTDGLQTRLVKCLRDLVAFDTPNRVVLARNGGLEEILDLLPLCAEETRGYLFEIFSALVMSREVRRALIHIGGLGFLVEAASFGKMVSRARAAHAIGLLGTARRVRHILVDLGVIPVLINLLREGDSQAKLTAGNCLGIISSHVDYLRPIAQAGAIPLYAELLVGSEALGKEIAEDVFCILAVSRENALLICQHLVRILQGDNEEAKAAAADVLWCLSGYKHSVSVVRESAVIPLLLDLLQEGCDDAREKALGALVQMSYEEADRKALAEAGAIPVFIGLLRNESDELKDNAIEALINFSEDTLLSERVSDVFDDPMFQTVRDRLVRIRAADEHMVRSLRQLTVDQLTLDPDFL